MKLYDLERSGNCYKIRLLLSILGLEYDLHAVDLGAGELSSDEFLFLNPNGLVPVLTDGDNTICDSAAILTYLAGTYGDPGWLPTEPAELARVVRWLVFEQGEIRYGLARARATALKFTTKFARSGTLEESQAIAVDALGTLNRQLSTGDWLAGGAAATICDIACYPYTAMGGEGGISLEPYAGVGHWMQRIENLPGYIALPGKS